MSSIPGAAELLHCSDNLSELVVEVVGEDEVDGLDLAEVFSVGQGVRVWKIRQVHCGGGLQRNKSEVLKYSTTRIVRKRIVCFIA